MKKMRDIVNAEKCVFSKEALTRFATWNLHNHGGSDEATEMNFAGVLDALFYDIGFEYSPEQLGKACPSQRTISRYELHLAVDCVAKVLSEIKEDGAESVGIMTDHGHRSGQDHFVVVITWSGKIDNQRRIKYFCPSIDSSGHTALEAAQAVKLVFERFLGDGVVVVHCASGDAGGGASIQHLHPKLIDLGVMAVKSKEANCSLHGKQKAIENASIKTLGDQGLGCRGPTQMIYVFVCLVKKVKQIGGIKLLDSLWAIVFEEIRNNKKFQDISTKKFPQAWSDLMEKIESFDITDDKSLDDLVKFMTESPRNIQDPVWTRWGSVSFVW